RELTGFAARVPAHGQRTPSVRAGAGRRHAARGRYRHRAGAGREDRSSDMTAPYTVPPPMMPPPRARRTGRRIMILVIVLLAILGLLLGLDRAAAAITADRIAAKLQTEGFPVEPNVTVEGFPFLNQLISRHLDGVQVVAPEFPVGSVTASIDV